MYSPSKLVLPEFAYINAIPNKIKHELRPKAVRFIIQIIYYTKRHYLPVFIPALIIRISSNPSSVKCEGREFLPSEHRGRPAALGGPRVS